MYGSIMQLLISLLNLFFSKELEYTQIHEYAKRNAHE